jgi:hypothetical protein
VAPHTPLHAPQRRHAASDTLSHILFQFAQHSKWQERGLLALVGVGGRALLAQFHNFYNLIPLSVEPGLSNVLARYAEKNLFSELDEVSTKDGSSLEVPQPCTSASNRPGIYHQPTALCHNFTLNFPYHQPTT